MKYAIYINHLKKQQNIGKKGRLLDSHQAGWCLPLSTYHTNSVQAACIYAKHRITTRSNATVSIKWNKTARKRTSTNDYTLYTKITSIFYDAGMNMAETPQESPLSDEELSIYGSELREILKMNGKKQYEYAYHINKPASFVGQTLFYSRQHIPFIYAEALVTLVGEKNFRRALKTIRSRPIYY